MRRPAAFLDRDGTLIRLPEKGRYLTSAAEFTWLPKAADGVALLASAGYVPVVVSNQRGVALGEVTGSTLAEVERLLQAGLEARGCRIERFCYCPHDTDDGCKCRKPKPGMLEDAAASLQLDLGSSWMFGDACTDVEAAHCASCRAALVGSVASACAPELRAHSLWDAATSVVSSRPGARG